MAYTIKVNEKEGYITVTTEGVLKVKDIELMGKDFVEKEIKTGFRKVFIDIINSRIKARFIEAFTFTAKSDIPILEGEKNAILVGKKSPDKLKIKIYCMQSTISGLHCRMFYDKEEALDWLLR